ncbi:MAG: alpha/beta fold hydrolase, partial [Gammaproteobacteria bacterium]
MKTIEMVYDEFGEPDSPPLIILHGFFASARNWRFIAGGLSKKFHVYTPDLRNHGASPHAPEMDYPAMAGDLDAFLENRGLEKASLLGHSMGGKAAMWFALNFPDRVEKLVVADIAPVGYRHSFDGIIRALKDLRLEDIGNRRQAEAALAASIPTESFRQFLLQNLV